MRVSTESNWRVDTRMIIAVAALIAVLFYLLVSAVIFRIGFPLDDTWIHLTYARNLAEHGEWAFRLGERSAGSTSPLWTFLLSIGFVFNLAPYIWTYLLGWVLLTLLGIQAENITRHAYIVFVVLSMLISRSRNYLALGLMTGISIWVRPDGLTLLGPLLFTALLVEKDSKSRGEAVVKILISFGALFVPYLLFNLALSGNPMPNTFYAKQAEYRAYWLAIPFLSRVIGYIIPLIASPFLVLLPGAVIWIIKSVRMRNWATLGAILWFLGYIFIYLMRMPPYQHARYVIPAFPILYLWGMLGMIEFVLSPQAKKRIVFGWQVLLGATCIIFSYIAARQNAYDVYWIESEMVQTARWVQQNIPPDKLLAVHDIGALGYYVPNPMIDMAGLITPDVVPFIRDSAKLKDYLNLRSADYLIVFPGQYSKLIAQRMPLFISGLQPELLHFDDHIEVFPWK